MELHEFVAQQKALLDDFAADYERRKRRKQLTLYRPHNQWEELYGEFKDIYGDKAETDAAA